MVWRVVILQRNFCLNFTENNWLSHQYIRFPWSILISFEFLTYVRNCSIKTELIDGSSYAKNCFNCWIVCSEVYWQFSMSLAPLDKGVVARKIGCPLSANSNSISSAIWSQAPCGLFSSAEYHFFSEPGPMNDHCPIQSFFASTLTTPPFAKHSSLLPFLSQEMSLNIDKKRILPVKVSGVSPKSLSRSLTLPQSCNVVNPGKMFHSNSVGSPLIPS